MSKEAQQKNLSKKYEDFYETLIEEGLIVERNVPIKDMAVYENHEMIKVKGKPLSQEISEARR